MIAFLAGCIVTAIAYQRLVIPAAIRHMTSREP